MGRIHECLLCRLLVTIRWLVGRFNLYLRIPLWLWFNCRRSWQLCSGFSQTANQGLSHEPFMTSSTGNPAPANVQCGLVRTWSTDLLSFYNTKQWNRPQNKRRNKHISDLFCRFVRTVEPQPYRFICSNKQKLRTLRQVESKKTKKRTRKLQQMWGRNREQEISFITFQEHDSVWHTLYPSMSSSLATTVRCTPLTLNQIQLPTHCLWSPFTHSTTLKRIYLQPPPRDCLDPPLFDYFR